MKTVMLSIKPKYCELIANGKKTIEVRKTKPKLEMPFKCYIYCTASKPFLVYADRFNGQSFIEEYCLLKGYAKEEAEKIWDIMNGKVIGEFTCDKIDTITVLEVETLVNGQQDNQIYNKTCVSREDIEEYIGYEFGDIYYPYRAQYGKDIYGWHISDLKIYDKPKELSEFTMRCDRLRGCKGCEYYYLETTEEGCYEECCCNNSRPITRPPQSWCYVEGSE